MCPRHVPWIFIFLSFFILYRGMYIDFLIYHRVDYIWTFSSVLQPWLATNAKEFKWDACNLLKTLKLTGLGWWVGRPWLVGFVLVSFSAMKFPFICVKIKINKKCCVLLVLRCFCSCSKKCAQWLEVCGEWHVRDRTSITPRSLECNNILDNGVFLSIFQIPSWVSQVYLQWITQVLRKYQVGII
jgi:hypothetical protein